MKYAALDVADTADLSLALVAPFQSINVPCESSQRLIRIVPAEVLYKLRQNKKVQQLFPTLFFDQRCQNNFFVDAIKFDLKYDKLNNMSRQELTDGVLLL